MKWTKVKISDIKPNKDNPRIIKDESFKKLVKSVKEFPQMLEIRPIVVNSEMIVIGGNQRYKACLEAGFKEVPIVFADDLTPEQEKEFVIKDNVQAGAWDLDLLNGYELEKLDDWGLDLEIKSESEIYSRKILSPHYEVTGEKPEIHELIDDSKTKDLIKKIEASKIPEELKEILRMASMRFSVINFEKMAEFYAHESKEVQELFEENALVIIDFEKAIQNGFVQMSQSISDQYFSDYEE